MTEQEFPPEVIEAAVVSNIGYYAVQEYREAHMAIVEFLKELNESGVVHMQAFEHLMDNVLLTLVHARDFMRLVTEKTVDPLLAEKDKYGPVRADILKIAIEDERIARLRRLVNEDLAAYEVRAEEEAKQRAEKLADSFEAFLKGASNDSSSD